MSDYPGTGRLEPEILAAYIDGELPPEARAKVEAEIAADPENYEWLVNVMAAVDAESTTVGGETLPSGHEALGDGRNEPDPATTEVPAPPLGGNGSVNARRVVPVYRRPLVIGGISAVAIAASVLLIVRLQPQWYSRMRGPNVGEAVTRLVDAVGEERYIEGRLMGGFRYGPSRPVLRGASDASSDNLRLAVALGDLRRLIAEAPSAPALRAYGVALLLSGDIEQSVTVLRNVYAGDRSDETTIDLSAALIALGRKTEQRQPIEEALALLATAVSSPSPRPEALYNHALALEAIASPEAIAAWERAARADPASPWALDAKRKTEGHVLSPTRQQ